MRPLCLGASGSVRATSMHHLAWCANVVHTFCPVTTHSSPSRDGARLQRRQVRARLRLGESLAPDLVGGQDRRQEALSLLLGPVRDHGRAAHREAEDVGHRRALLRAHHLLDEDRLLDQRRAATAVLLGPGDPGPAGCRAACAASRAGSSKATSSPPSAPARGGCPRARRAPRRGTPPRRVTASGPSGCRLAGRLTRAIAGLRSAGSGSRCQGPHRSTSSPAPSPCRSAPSHGGGW